MSNSIKFITGVRYNKAIMQAVNSITFCYDPTWLDRDNVAEHMVSQGYASLPIAFFHTKRCTEVMQSEVSTQKMMFYNGLSSEKQVSSAGVVNVVADNIVIKPKTYKLDIIIPYETLTLYQRNYVMDTASLRACQSFLTEKDSEITNIENAVLTATTVLATAERALLKVVLSMINPTSLITMDYVNMLLEAVSQTPDYNRISLEAMWRNRAILKMKMWNSWAYKYVAIQDLEISKEPDEDGVYEATLTVTEVPILTLDSSRLGTVEKVSNADKIKAKAVIAEVDNAEVSPSGTLNR